MEEETSKDDETGSSSAPADSGTLLDLEQAIELEGGDTSGEDKLEDDLEQSIISFIPRNVEDVLAEAKRIRLQRPKEIYLKNVRDLSPLHFTNNDLVLQDSLAHRPLLWVAISSVRIFSIQTSRGGRKYRRVLLLQLQVSKTFSGT